MQIWQEPVRGSVLPPAAYVFDGLERLRGYGRQLYPATSLHHHLGFRTTQASNGSAVGSMPVTGWLAHPDGVVDVGLLAASVCGLAAYTAIPPKTELAPLHMSYAPVRVPPSDARMMVGRGHVVRTSPDWVYVEGSVEDDAGRVIADASAHMTIRPVELPVPDEPPALEPLDPPRYATPDPYRRPVPADKHAGIREFHERGCVAAMHAIRDGELPAPPLYEMAGIRPVDVEEGRCTSELTTSPWLQGVDRGLFPGWLAAWAIDATGVVARTLVPPGEMPGVLQASLTFLRSVPVDGRVLTARARGERVGQLVLSSVDVFDGDERVATGATTARVVPEPTSPARRPADRTLTTVMFTDIVGSTAAAERAGDSRWAETLRRHHELVRSELEQFGGREVKTTGDGFLATFGSATRAVECARAIRHAVHQLGIEIRAGLHTGECEMAGGDVAGIAVHTAARIEAAAGPGEVLVSETTRALTAGSASGLSFTDRGQHELKGLDEPFRLYRVD